MWSRVGRNLVAFSHGISAPIHKVRMGFEAAYHEVGEEEDTRIFYLQLLVFRRQWLILFARGTIMPHFEIVQ